MRPFLGALVKACSSIRRLKGITFQLLISLLIGIYHGNLSARVCAPANSAFRDFQALRQNAALIGEDDRELRGKANTPADVEAAQVRMYCLSPPLRGNAAINPTLADISAKEQRISNGTMAFDDDVAIVPRHVFRKKDGSPGASPKNCYIEHVRTGQIIPVVDAEWPPVPPNSDLTNHRDRDFAVVRLSRKLPLGSHLNKEDIHLDFARNLNTNIQVISNYGDVPGNKFKDDALTITNCKRFGYYSFASNATSNIAGTNCDTGPGSSGSGAYMSVDSRPKMFGLVSGDITDAPPGGTFNFSKLSTLVVNFDQSLFEAYDRLAARPVPEPAKQPSSRGRKR